MFVLKTNIESKTTNRGFTIVELLIVIVVIGILAAITIVSYNGLQDRAHAARAASIVDSYAKILDMYRVDHGHYPYEDQASGIEACLGNAQDFTGTGPLAEGQCAPANSSSTPVSVSSSLNNLLTPYANPLPAGDLAPVTDGTVSFRGVVYIASAGVSSGSPGAALVYFLNGTQDCPRGTTYNFNDEEIGVAMTQCAITLSS